MTARIRRPAGAKSKTAPLTAHVGWSPPVTARRGRRAAVEAYHAVADQFVLSGGVARDSGQALCGQVGSWPDPPLGLFTPMVSCPACRAFAATAHITIAEGPGQ